ncbi:MAG: hypothetical protein IPO30_08195 [Hyphomonadaceae bacterium]|nr:hypothetical protein [Hyphomonadaceae bacterium]
MRADYDFSDQLNVYVEANYARTKSRAEAGAGTGTFVTANPLGFTLPSTYAYIPANLAAQMATNNINRINVQKQFAFNAKQMFESRTQPDRHRRDLRLRRQLVGRHLLHLR